MGIMEKENGDYYLGFGVWGYYRPRMGNQMEKKRKIKWNLGLRRGLGGLGLPCQDAKGNT